MPGRTKDRPAPRTTTAPDPLPAPGVDVLGRLVPETEAERRAHAEELRLALEELAEIADETDTPETWAEVFRGMDAARPHRPLFEGLY